MIQCYNGGYCEKLYNKNVRAKITYIYGVNRYNFYIYIQVQLRQRISISYTTTYVKPITQFKQSMLVNLRGGCFYELYDMLFSNYFFFPLKSTFLLIGK